MVVLGVGGGRLERFLREKGKSWGSCGGNMEGCRRVGRGVGGGRRMGV